MGLSIDDIVASAVSAAADAIDGIGFDFRCGEVRGSCVQLTKDESTGYFSSSAYGLEESSSAVVSAPCSHDIRGGSVAWLGDEPRIVTSSRPYTGCVDSAKVGLSAPLEAVTYNGAEVFAAVVRGGTNEDIGEVRGDMVYLVIPKECWNDVACGAIAVARRFTLADGTRVSVQRFHDGGDAWACECSTRMRPQ